MSNGTASSEQCAGWAINRDQALVTSIVGFSAAGALAITAAVLFVTSSSSSSSSSSTGLVCAPSLLAAGATCQLRF
jgi:hypothetical protein